MLWIDHEFDRNDMLARKYMKYNGKYYDKGTVVKIKGPYGPTIATFNGWRFDNRGCFVSKNGDSSDLYEFYNYSAANKYILEIIDPVCPTMQQEIVPKENRNKPPEWDVEIAWIWYVVIMVVATIFKARLFIWALTTVIFFAWKNGFTNGGKK